MTDTLIPPRDPARPVIVLAVDDADATRLVRAARIDGAHVTITPHNAPRMRGLIVRGLVVSPRFVDRLLRAHEDALLALDIAQRNALLSGASS